MLNETEIINFLKNQFPVSHQTPLLGIGDDAAVFPLNEHEAYVITTDSLNEDIHFRLSYFSPIDLAIKALQVNLSDIAAMGAKAKFALLNLALPRHLDPQWLNSFLTAFCRGCQQEGIVLIGGDTTASAEKLFINVTLIGQAKQRHLKFRHGAQVTDKICLIGTVGLAHLGLIALEAHRPIATDYQAAFLRPQAKAQEGQWLGAQSAVTSLMDVSDGLFMDMSRLCKASQVGALVQLERLISDATTLKLCQEFELDPLECALTGGEDYALLCTIQAQNFPSLATAFKEKFGYPLQPIGEIVKGDAISLKKGDKNYPPPPHIFSHFGEN